MCSESLRCDRCRCLQPPRQRQRHFLCLDSRSHRRDDYAGTAAMRPPPPARSEKHHRALERPAMRGQPEESLERTLCTHGDNHAAARSVSFSLHSSASGPMSPPFRSSVTDGLDSRTALTRSDWLAGRERSSGPTHPLCLCAAYSHLRRNRLPHGGDFFGRQNRRKHFVVTTLPKQPTQRSEEASVSGAILPLFSTLLLWTRPRARSLFPERQTHNRPRILAAYATQVRTTGQVSAVARHQREPVSIHARRLTQ